MSGVLASFVTDASKQFQRDPADMTYRLLLEIYDRQINASLPRTIDTDAISKLDPGDSEHAFICNALLYSSLGLCTIAASLALAAKLWVISYGERAFSASLTPYKRAMKRQEAYSGVLAWKLEAAIQSLPLILLIALVVFGFYVQ